MKRPIGVVLVCLVLGGFAALQLLGAGLYGVLAFTMRHGLPATATGPGVPAGFPAATFVGLMLAVALFVGCLAGWSIATIVGLIRLRSWARYSALVIGGLLAVFGVFGLVSVAIAMPMMTKIPKADPAMMRIGLLLAGAMNAMLGSIGGWWLVYFNLRSIRAVFGAAGPGPGAGYGVGGRMLYRSPCRFAHVPTVIVILAGLFLFGAGGCALMAFVPLPAFLFGFTLGRAATMLVYLLFAGSSAWIGLGLLRLDNRARLATYALTAFGAVNFLVILTPWGRGRYEMYQAGLSARMHLGAPGGAFQPYSGVPMLVMTFAACLAIYGVQWWALSRYRGAFLTAPPPPRMG